MEEKDATASSSTNDVANEELIPGYQNASIFSQQALRAIMLATKASNQLPSSGDDYDYYSSFSSFRELMNMEGSRLLQMIQGILRYHGIKGNVASAKEGVEVEDRFDTLVDGNDQLLERIGMFLDEAAGVKKDETPLVVASVTPKGPLSGSWNRNKFKSPGGSYRLLAARNIQRPQLKFTDKIDNSSSPFVPKIKHKPHAMKPLPESILDAQSEDKVHSRHDTEFTGELLGYPHPYEYELDNFVPMPEQLQEAKIQKVRALDDSPPHVMTELSELEELCEALKQHTEVAVDLEHHSYRTFQGITCLMQVSTRTHDYLVDTLALRPHMHILNEVFTNPRIVKVFHGADSDVEWLQRDFGLYIVNLFDTHQASRMLSLARNSLAHLLLTYCGVEADKQYQLADWRMRPLPAELLRYAREDTHYLLHIYDLMKNQLIQHGNQQNNLLLSVIQRSTQVCKKVYKKPVFGGEDYMEVYIRSKKAYNTRQLAALKGIYAWRNRIARTEDESLGYTLPNHMMLQISDVLPRESQGILACCNPIPPLVRQSLSELHEIIKQARDVPLEKVVPAASHLQPSRQQHPKYNTSSLLHCPHDSTYQHAHRNIPAFTLDKSLMSSASCLMGEAVDTRSSNVLLLERPQASVFDYRPQPAPTSAAAKKACIILDSMASPFEKFLMNNTRVGVTYSADTAAVDVKPSVPAQPATQPATSLEFVEWKLMPASAKPKPASNPVVAVKTEPEAVLPSGSDEDTKGVIPLSQLTVKKKKKRGVEGGDIGPASKVSAADMAEKLAEIEKSFQPHEYTQEQMDIFTGSSTKKDGKEGKNGKKKKVPTATLR